MSTQTGTCGGYDAAQITAAISAALKAQDMPAVATLMNMLAVADPEAAEALVNVIEIANLLIPAPDALSTHPQTQKERERERCRRRGQRGC